jgi:uncharacterized phosphosugar-binding protein
MSEHLLRGIEHRFDEILHRSIGKNRDTIVRVATLLADTYRHGAQAYSFGTGHSHVLIEEMFYRAGVPNFIHPLWDAALMLHEGPERSGELEKVRGYYRRIFDQVTWHPGDVLWAISNSGRNWVIVELAQAAKAQGAKVIALTSLDHSRSIKPLSTDGPKLYELADYVLDNCGVLGDATVCLEGVETRVVPTSTFVGVTLIHLVMAEVVTILAGNGHPLPSILVSNNVDGGHD